MLSFYSVTAVVSTYFVLKYFTNKTCDHLLKYGELIQIIYSVYKVQNISLFSFKYVFLIMLMCFYLLVLCITTSVLGLTTSCCTATDLKGFTEISGLYIERK